MKMNYRYLLTKENGLQYSLTCEVDDSTKATAANQKIVAKIEKNANGL